jgi:hypothetical protein
MCLSVVQNRFEYIICKYPKISCEELDSVLRMTWLDVDYLMNEPSVKMQPEPRTFEKYLMVSKHNKKTWYSIGCHTGPGVPRTLL